MKVKTKDWYQSSNFWIAAIMAVAGIFVGFSEEMARELVAGIFGLIAVGKSLHNYFKSAQIDWKAWIQDSNLKNYVLVIITSFVAVFDPSILDRLQELVSAIITGDVQGILVAIFSLATILYNIISTKKKTATARR